MIQTTSSRNATVHKKNWTVFHLWSLFIACSYLSPTRILTSYFSRQQVWWKSHRFYLSKRNHLLKIGDQLFLKCNSIGMLCYYLPTQYLHCKIHIFCYCKLLWTICLQFFCLLNTLVCIWSLASVYVLNNVLMSLITGKILWKLFVSLLTLYSFSFKKCNRLSSLFWRTPYLQMKPESQNPRVWEGPLGII